MTVHNPLFAPDSQTPNPAPSWPFRLFGKAVVEDKQAWPEMVSVVASGDDGARPEAAGHGLAGSPPVEKAANPFLEPDDGARLVVPDAGEQSWQGVASQEVSQADDLEQSEDAQQKEGVRPETVSPMHNEGSAVSHDDLPTFLTGQGAAGHQEAFVPEDDDESLVKRSVGKPNVDEECSAPAQASAAPKYLVEPALTENIFEPEKTAEALSPDRAVKAAQPQPDQPQILPQDDPPKPEPENTVSMVEEKPAPQKEEFQSQPKQTGLAAGLPTPSLPKPNQATLPTEVADLVTVEEAVEIFQAKGLPRHMRTIQKYCAKKRGRALVCHQMPAENGIRYMIERSSILRFISDAAQQTPTGKLDIEPAPQAMPQTIRRQTEQLQPPHPAAIAQAKSAKDATSSVVGDVAIFDHPFVKRLERQVEKLESRNEDLQSKIQDVLVDANERLAELQKASAVAQSESLGRFLLDLERIRNRLEDDERKKSTVLHSPPPQFDKYNV